MIWLIAGSRTFTDYKLLLQSLPINKKPDLIIEGGARGADTLGRMYAIEHNIPYKEIKPDWKKYGTKAGFVRNKEMVDMLTKKDFAYIFWDGKSNGTKNTIDLCESKGIPFEVIPFTKIKIEGIEND